MCPVVDRHSPLYLQDRNEFVVTVEKQARSLGVSPERAKDRLLMRLDL